MAYTETSLADIALGNIGVGASIGDLRTENSAEAIAMRRYFNHCRDVLYRMRAWSFATRLIQLQDLGVTGTLYDGIWGHRYQYPNVAMRINKIVNPAQRSPATEADKIKFEIASRDNVAGGKVILCDQKDAIAEYNYLLEDVGLWDAEFAENFCLYLGLRASGSLKANAAMVRETREQWQAFLQNCMSTIDSESQPDGERASQFQTVRG